MTSRKGREAGTRPLKRKVATRKPRKTLVVFCQGERTEPEYLNALKLQPSVRDVAAKMQSLRVSAINVGV